MEWQVEQRIHTKTPVTLNYMFTLSLKHQYGRIVHSQHFESELEEQHSELIHSESYAMMLCNCMEKIRDGRAKNN